MNDKVSKKTFDKLTDVMLKQGGTPRRELNDYPYNEFESRDLLRKAEAAVMKSLKILGLEVER